MSRRWGATPKPLLNEHGAESVVTGLYLDSGMGVIVIEIDETDHQTQDLAGNPWGCVDGLRSGTWPWPVDGLKAAPRPP